MTKRDFEMKSDGVGIALFAFGVFCAVLVVQAVFQGVDAGATGTVELLAAVWVNSIGVFPSLVLNGALAALGARMFLAGALPNLVRHVLGAAFLAASLSILLGAFGGAAGGTFGARTGGALSGATHVVLGAVLGALAAIATVWFVWLRRDEVPAEEPTLVRNPDRELEAQNDADEGVSTEEAEALLPVHIIPAPPVVRAAPPPSPYPEDVRKKGEIPAGTRPLVSKESAPQAFAPAVYRWTAPGARQEGDAVKTGSSVAASVASEADEGIEADRFLLVDEEANAPQALVADKNDVSKKLGALPRPAWEEGDEDGPVDAYGTPLELVKQLRAEGDFEEELSEASQLVVVAREKALAQEAAPLVAVLETHVEPTVDEALELPVVEELEPAARTEVELALERELAELELAEEVVPEVRRTQAESHPEEDLEPELDPVAAERAALREELRSLTFVTETEASADDLELAEHAPAEPDDELSLAVRELQTLPDELEATPGVLEAPVAAIEVEAPLFALAAEPPAELLPEVVEEALAAETKLFEAAPVEPIAEVLAIVEPSEAEHPSTHPEVSRKPAPRVQIPSLFDGPREPTSSVFETEPAPEPEPAPRRKSKARSAEAPALVGAALAEASAEREVVLTPQAAPVEHARKSPLGKQSSDRTALLAEIGCLFIDRGRVAVSMLQREYSMDFDDACKVLDDLQDMGLLGPYLGGQRRDILLTREAWLERVSAS